MRPITLAMRTAVFSGEGPEDIVARLTVAVSDAAPDGHGQCVVPSRTASGARTRPVAAESGGLTTRGRGRGVDGGLLGAARATPTPQR